MVTMGYLAMTHSASLLYIPLTLEVWKNTGGVSQENKGRAALLTDNIKAEKANKLRTFIPVQLSVSYTSTHTIADSE